MKHRIFQGIDTQQITADGKPAATEGWYWEPVDYDGDVLWSPSYQTQSDAAEAAQCHVTQPNLPTFSHRKCACCLQARGTVLELLHDDDPTDSPNPSKPARSPLLDWT